MKAKIYKYWACEDPDKYWDGREYDNTRAAVYSANLNRLHVVKVTFSLEGSELIHSPAPKKIEEDQ